MKAEVVDAIRELEDAEGRLTPIRVVEAARDPVSPLHNHFEWDDAIAAAKQRIDTARRLIVQVEMRVKYGKLMLTTPIYMHDPTLDAGVSGYRAVMKIKSDKEAVHEALASEMSRIRSILGRVRALSVALGREDKLAEIDRVVEDFVDSLESPPEDRPEA